MRHRPTLAPDACVVIYAIQDAKTQSQGIVEGTRSSIYAVTKSASRMTANNYLVCSATETCSVFTVGSLPAEKQVWQ